MWGVCVSADGKYVVSGSDDRTPGMTTLTPIAADERKQNVPRHLPQHEAYAMCGKKNKSN
jgi:hypothetical protein